MAKINADNMPFHIKKCVSSGEHLHTIGFKKTLKTYEYDILNIFKTFNIGLLCCGVYQMKDMKSFPKEMYRDKLG